MKMLDRLKRKALRQRGNAAPPPAGRRQASRECTSRPPAGGIPLSPMPPAGGKEREITEEERKHHLHIELTPEQSRLLCSQAKSCGLTKRAFLARLIEGQPVKARPSQEIKALRTEVRRIGVNINQIARSVNAGVARPEDARFGLCLLEQVYEQMRRLEGL